MGDLTLNFSRSEFQCACGCGFDNISLALVDDLQKIRSHFGATIKINSGCRCFKHNKEVGGSEHSRHLMGIAADIVVMSYPTDIVHRYIDTVFTSNNGLGMYSTFIHYDVRKDERARW